MKVSLFYIRDKKQVIKMSVGLLLMAAVLLLQQKLIFAAEKQATIYEDNNFYYIIDDEEKREVTLIGIASGDAQEELEVPGTVHIDEQDYTVEHFDIRWDYYDNSEYKAFYNSVKKLTFAEDFRGTVEDPVYAFPNVRTIEFKGIITPRKVTVTLSNINKDPDVLFIVPKGQEAAYGKIIEEYISYYNGSDLYEMEIMMKPTIIGKGSKVVEHGVFSRDGLLYQVTSSAKEGKGKVQLIGITMEKKHSYLSLPKQLENDGYTYELTKLGKFGLVRIGASVIVVPDTVTKMDSYVFDKQVELLFLSSKCKTIPSNLITDEDNESNLRFIYVPEGVTTISDKAFTNYMKNDASIILPTTIKSLGKQSLYGFKYVTFLNKKPIAKLSSAIKGGTTVKVASKVKADYKKALGTKITLVTAKNVVKTTKLTVNKASLTMKKNQTATLKGTLSKSSNETVFWLSSDSSIFEISSKGVIKGKKAGTAYAIAYTRTSGKYKAVKVTITAK